MLENLRKKSFVYTYRNIKLPMILYEGNVFYKGSQSLSKTRLIRSETIEAFSRYLTKAWSASRLFEFHYKKVKFNMIVCSSGQFMKGKEGMEDDNRLKSVNVFDFLLGETEVTQELYEAVMGVNPSRFQESKDKAQEEKKISHPFTMQHPVENVSWIDAIKFCNKLSKLHGLELCYTYDKSRKDWECDDCLNGYRLPTEVEWEYAARMGHDNAYLQASHLYENVISDFKDNTDFTQTYPVKASDPNAWGFYGMLDNVSEWCTDLYYPYTRTEDFKKMRVRRGLYRSVSVVNMVVARGMDPPDRKLNSTGFRLCRNLY